MTYISLSLPSHSLIPYHSLSLLFPSLTPSLPFFNPHPFFLISSPLPTFSPTTHPPTPNLTHPPHHPPTPPTPIPQHPTPIPTPNNPPSPNTHPHPQQPPNTHPNTHTPIPTPNNTPNTHPNTHPQHHPPTPNTHPHPQQPPNTHPNTQHPSPPQHPQTPPQHPHPPQHHPPTPNTHPHPHNPHPQTPPTPTPQTPTTPTHPPPHLTTPNTQQRGFTVAISVQDGLVLQVSPAITEVLGFPKDMLIGQSFIDFVYPKDSINLSSKIIHGLNMPFRNESIKDNYGTTFFCRMRMYHGLRTSGFGVRNKRTVYKPCKMVLKFHDPTSLDETASTCDPNFALLLAELFLFRVFIRVIPFEMPAKGSFSIRHTASCNFSEYAPEAIPYLGHLPQDLTGNSVFDCYHPEDMPLLKEAYEEIVREQGKPHRSKPYRFRTFNGSYVTLETEWLCFVNPWTKRIDSIIGQYRVLKGPSDIGIFMDPANKAPTPLPEEVMKEALKAQKDILELLAKPVAAYKDPSKGSQEMRRRTLANMMSSIVDELDNLEKRESQTPPTQHSALPTTLRQHKQHHSQCPPLRQDHSSPVQYGLESVTSSSESPSSYGHLNYSETIHRFFRSQPKTMSSDESGDSKMEVSHPGSDGSNINKQSQDNSQSNSASGSGGSGDNCYHTRKSESTANGSRSGSGDTGCRTSSQRRSYKHVQLTEEVLSRHNFDMQKMFMQRQRTGLKPNKDKAKHKTMKKPLKKLVERPCGVKRCSGAQEHVGPPTKQLFLDPSAAGSSCSLKPSSLDLWAQRESQTHRQSSGSGVVAVGPGTAHVAPPYPSLVPGFYFPTGTSSLSQVTPVVPRDPAPVPLVLPPQPPTFLHPQGVAAVQYIPGIMYQPVVPPLFNAHQPVVPPLFNAHQPLVVYQHTAVQHAAVSLTQLPLPMSDGEKPSGAESDHDLFENIPQSAKSFVAKHSTSHLRRPDSQATSVKAEPGSARGSVASASGKVISSHSHVAESIRSYLEDTTTVSPGCNNKVSQYSQSTSVRAEAESIGSPDKHKIRLPRQNSR
ncbi:Period circadian protein [Chionoecetes opilio]|uniref:Period circadian protein n=1 Tax=Chionoecetes opilio TaxID=41210 RepID=A0A8J5CR82_CHIOP|nr:Period circadian protein [Chionoecetes opilio]